MLGSHKLIAFVGARDTVAAVDFYRDRLGLPLVAEDEYALTFDAGGTLLRVVRVQEVADTRYTVLAWEVPDIAAAATALRDAGVRFERYQGMKHDALGVWESPEGTKIAWFRDPAGNVLSITQLHRG